MQNEMDLFFKNINEAPVEIKKGSCKIIIKDASFGSVAVNALAEKIKYIIYNNIKAEVKINIRSRTIADLATIVVFEYMVYYLLKSTECKVCITIMPDNLMYAKNFLTNSITYNFIKDNRNFKIKRKNFIKDFESEVPMINFHRYRKLLKNNNIKNETINKTSSDVYSFLKSILFDEEYIEDCVEAIGELCSNALEHTEYDCILTIECGIGLNKKNEERNILSIVVSNVSENLFFYKLRDFHKNGYKNFNVINQALVNHRLFFGKPLEIVQDIDKIKYDEEYFYIVSAFQNGVSTRMNQEGTGGTGLLKLVYNILGKTENSFCYILTGNKVLFFIENLMNPVEDKFVGFNKNNDYLNSIPDAESLGTSAMTFGGTIFSLNLITDTEVEKNE